MEEMDYTTKYDKNITDLDESDLSRDDVKFNPDYFLMKTVDKMTESLANPNLREGKMQFSILTLWLETQLRAKKNLDEEKYVLELQALKESPEYVDANDERKDILLNMKKAELLIKNIFTSKPLTDSMKL